MLHNLVLPQNKMLVSENESLELWRVTDAHMGVYTLTVNTGNKSLQREFIITVLKATTNLRTGKLPHFFAAISLFVPCSISAFPQGWINNLGEAQETELLNKLHWTRELILDFCY